MAKYMRIADNTGGFMHMPFTGDLPEGAEVIPRLPKPYEEWINGQWILSDENKAIATEQALLANDPAHIERAHMRKQIEAMLLDNGVSIVGSLLEAEAKQKKMPVNELAAIVKEKAAKFIKAELARQKG